MAQESSNENPSTITGGCLCGSILYKLHFPRGSAWPPGVCYFLFKLKIAYYLWLYQSDNLIVISIPSGFWLFPIRNADSGFLAFP